MEITCIGDIHGRKNWIDIVKENSNSNFIFLGDYVDPYSNESISVNSSIKNLIKIIDFKKENSNKVSLLIGNHDAQYLFHPNFRTNSLSKGKYLQKLLDLYQENKNLFQFAIQKDKYLFTHAGLSNEWFNEHFRLLKYFGLDDDMSNLAITLNKIGKDLKWKVELGTISYYRGGKDDFGGPLWADSVELGQNHLTGFHQIVGHNKILDITTIGDSESSITFCDCLFVKGKGYTLSI